MSTIKLDALEGVLARSLPPAVWIHGDEPLLVLEAADAVRAHARKAGISERLVIEVDRSFKADHFAAETSALSLFGSARLFDLRCAGKPGKEVGESIAQATEQADDSLRSSRPLVISNRSESSACSIAASPKVPGFRESSARGWSYRFLRWNAAISPAGLQRVWDVRSSAPIRPPWR